MFRSTAIGRSARVRRGAAFATRLAAASLGGYLLAVALAFFLARALPLERAEATTAAALAAILVMPAVAIWAFADARAWRVFFGVAGMTALLALLARLLGAPA